AERALPLPREQHDTARGIGGDVVEGRRKARGRGGDVVLAHLRDEKRDRRVAVGWGGGAGVHAAAMPDPALRFQLSESGNVTVSVDPLPGRASTRTVPPCASTISRTTCRPSPRPPKPAAPLPRR